MIWDRGYAMKIDSGAINLTFKEFILGRVPEGYKEAYKKSLLDSNLSRTFGLSIYIIAVQVALNLINILKPGESKGEDVMNYVYLSLVTMFVGVLFLVLSILVRRKKISSSVSKYFPYTLLYVYVVIQLIFLSFNIQMDAGMNCYIIALLLLGFFIIMPPIQSVLSIAATLFAAVMMMFLTRNSNDAWDTAIMTDTWANLIIITGLCAYMSVVMFRMYIRNFLSSAQLEEKNQQLNVVAQTDSLTGLYNRRGFFDIYESTLRDAAKSDGFFATAMIDIDYFKNYNDRNGHLEGDACLYKVAQILKGVTESAGGTVCRYGGEEFLAIFNAPSKEAALEIAERCRVGVEAKHMTGMVKPGEDVKPITISIGLSCLPTSELADKLDNSDAIIQIADDAVYAAKSSGRNKIVCA